MKPRKSIIIPLFICFLLAILIGKLITNDNSPDIFLYTYGVIVTSALIFLISLRYIRYVDPYVTASELLLQNPSLQEHQPLVSIMVAVYNEEQFINQCMQSLIHQSYEHTEVIVVNDLSTDRTRELLDAFKVYKNVKVIHLEKNVGKKKALATAMLQAKGEYFMFTDSDSVWGIHAVERIVDIFRTQPQIGAVSGHTRANNAEQNLLTRIQDTWYEGQFSIRKAFESSFGAVTCVSGPLAAFRRAAVYNLIPFWINDTFLGSEFKFATDRTKTALVLANPHFSKLVHARFPDSPFLNEIHEPKKWNVVYTYCAQAKTNVPETISAFLSQQIRWKKSFIRNIWLTGSFYWKKPLPAAIMYYLRILFVFMGPFIIFRNLVWLPMNGDWYSAALYLSGILFVGFTFAALHKVERPNENGWVYRPLMNLISTFVLSWIILYSLVTIKKMVWQRG